MIPSNKNWLFKVFWELAHCFGSCFYSLPLLLFDHYGVDGYEGHPVHPNLPNQYCLELWHKTVTKIHVCWPLSLPVQEIVPTKRNHFTTDVFSYKTTKEIAVLIQILKKNCYSFVRLYITSSTDRSKAAVPHFLSTFLQKVDRELQPPHSTR